jgi:two-component system capsular synthesis response regulator RcsB
MATATQTIRVSFLDDHALVRLSLSRFVEQQPDLVTAGSYGSSAEALSSLATAPTDVLVLDYALAPGDLSGSELILELKKKCPALQIIVLTASIDETRVSSCLEAGAAGVAHKKLPLPELMNAIRTIHGGQRFIDPQLSQP